MKRIILAVVALGAVVACADKPEMTAVDTGTDSFTPAEASIGASASARREIEALKSAWDAAWAAKDARAYAANYTANAEFVNPVGGVVAGRQGIRAAHVFLFTGPFAGSTQSSEVRRTVFLTRAIRIVDLDVALTGYAGLPPGLRETAPGIVRTRVKWVVVERQGGWKILAQHMTALPPAP